MPRCHHLTRPTLVKVIGRFQGHGHHAASFAPVIRAVTSSGRGLVDRLVGPLLAAAHDDHAVADREHVGHAVRDQHDGDALLFQPVDQAEHLLDLAYRDRGGRLVHHHQPRVGQPRPRDRNRLALAARHLLDEIVAGASPSAVRRTAPAHAPPSPCGRAGRAGRTCASARGRGRRWRQPSDCRRARGPDRRPRSQPRGHRWAG